MSIQLSNQEPFAKGGNRLCFIHPDDPGLVIKVRRPDRPLEKKRKAKKFPKNLRPLSSLDDNLEEFKVMRSLDKRIGESVYQVVSRCHGFVETDLGKGLVSELVRDGNQKISHTLKQYIWDNDFTEECQQAVTEFAKTWTSLCGPSRDLLLHNIVVQRELDGSITRLLVIDGLGSPNLVPDSFYSRPARKNRAEKKIQKLHEKIEQLLAQRGAEEFPGYHGLLIHDGDASLNSTDERSEN